MGAVIGSRAHYLDAPADAHRHIAGLVTSNDVSERTFQRGDAGGQWTKGKSCEAFNPVGPWLVPLRGDGDIRKHLWSWVNGSARQDSTTADMIFDVPHLIWYLSQFMALEPGDLETRARQKASPCPDGSRTSRRVTSWRSKSKDLVASAKSWSPACRAVAGGMSRG